MQLQLNILYDPEANVWVITDSNLPGLVAEASTLEQLGSKLDVIIPELIELNQPNTIS